MAKAGMVHLIDIMRELPPEVPVGVIFDVTQGKHNYAPEKVDEIKQAILAKADKKTLEPATKR